ncbi:MAG: hypothetical protein R6V67_05320, partial [Spirochaetia bacterium]
MRDKRYGKPALSGKSAAAIVLSVALLLPLFFSSCNVEPQISGDVVPEINLIGSSKGFSDVSIEEFRLRITGEDINFNKTYPADTKEIRVSLPEDDNVRFELEAPIASGSSYTGPVKSYGGVAYADLTAGEKTSVDFFLTPFETKILVPDYGGDPYGGGTPQLVQVDDKNGWTWDGEVSTFDTGSPVDIEIDNLGQIWVGYEGVELGGGLELRQKIDDPQAVPIITEISVTSLAFDRKNNYLYYIMYDGDGGSSIHRITTDFDANNTPEDLGNISKDIIPTFTPDIHPFGLTVDNEGYIYFVGINGNDKSIFKIDPDSPP